MKTSCPIILPSDNRGPSLKRIFIRCDTLTEKIDSYLYKYCRDLDSAFSQTLFCGCLAGLVIGCILDFFHFMKSQKRLNDLLREIEEVRGAK